jgi:hypothetical protein
MDPGGGHVSLRMVNVTWIDLDPLAFILHFLNQFRIVYRDYGRKGSAELTLQHPSIRKSWHSLRRQAAVARLV